MAKTTAAPKKAPSKTEIYASITDATELSKKQVAAVFETLSAEIKKALGRSGAKAFTIPGLAKISVIHKPATKARKGINPFTKEEQMFKAKPARNVVKVRALKSLKDMA